MYKKIVLCILIIGWMALVFSFSREPSVESAKLSGGITDRIISFIYSRNKLSLNRDEVDHIVRKTAHFTLYFAGGVLIFLFFNEYKIKLYEKILYSEGFGMFYAMTDEFHQSFVPGRSPQVTDVLLDSLGVLTGIAVTILILSLINKKYVALH